MVYTTFSSTSMPSKYFMSCDSHMILFHRLAMDIQSPEIYLGLSDEQLEKLLTFFYGQLSSFWDVVAMATNQKVGSLEESKEVNKIIFTQKNLMRLY